MRHLDEGTLQAWLDAPRSGMEPEEHAEIADHLASCARCAAVVAALRETSQDLERLLRSDASAEPPAPDFGRVRERARTLASARRPRPWRAARWVAGIAAGLAVGWFSNDLMRQRTPTPALETPAELSPPAAAAELRAGAGEPSAAEPSPEAPSRRAASAERREEERVAAPPPPPAAEADAILEEKVERAPTGEPAVRGRVVDENGRPLEAAQVSLPGTGLGALTRNDGTFVIPLRGWTPPDADSAVTVEVARIGYRPETAELDGRRDGSPLADIRLESTSIALDQIVVTGATARPALDVTVDDPSWGAPWVRVDRADAEVRAGFRLLIVPGLEVGSIDVGDVEGTRVVRIRQLQRDGTVLTLYESLATLDAAETPRTGATATERRGDVSILGHAPGSEATVRAILARAR